MGKTLEYDIFDALVDRLLSPRAPLRDSVPTAKAKPETAEGRTDRNPPRIRRKP